MAKLEDVVFADKVCYIDTDVTLPGLETTQNVWQADIGITRAEFAIAETGSVVLSSGTDHARLASLTPPVHVVLVDRIVNTLEEGIAQLSNRTSVIVSGTSRTADIEGVLVRGVHGPGDVIVVRSDGGDGATNA